MKKALLFVTVLFSFIGFSQTLDPTFNASGIVTNQFSTTPAADFINGAAMQTDGKIVIISSNKVIRIKTDETFDSAFNSFGFINIGNQLGTIKIQPDGKIIVAGLNFVYRINTDGTIDSSFGTNGMVNIQIDNNNMTIKSIGLRSDGKIVLGGYVSNGTISCFALSTLNIDGSFDTSFDFDGKVTFNINDQDSYGSELVIQNDDKIIITGGCYYLNPAGGTPSEFATARFNTNGTLDISFGTNGLVTTVFGLDSCTASSLDLQSNNSIVVSGVQNNKLVIARYTPAGVLDTTFNSTGKLITNKSCSTYNILHIKCLLNGKILISFANSSRKFNLYQINNDGSFDSTFGVNGTATSVFSTYDFSTYLLLKPDGKIITGGNSYSSSIINRIEKLQFSSNGIFESEQHYNTILGVDSIVDNIEQSSGKTIACGGIDKYSKNTMVRYNTDGSIDTTFGTNGILTPTSTFFILAKQLDDKLLINSYIQSITRYTADGIVDTTFGVNGIVDFSTNSPLIVNVIDAITVSQNGKINVAFDYSTDGSQCGPSHYGVLRLNIDGTLDTSFGTNGYANIPFDFYSADEFEFPQSIFEDTDGKLIITGTIENNTNTLGQVGTTRINNDGTIDTSFGTNGKIITEIGIMSETLSILKTTSNKYLINSYDIKSPAYTSLIQYNYDGSIDTTFGINGILSDHQHFFSVVLQPDGKILSGGTTNNQFAIYRNSPDGSLDTTFGTNGLLSTPISYSSNINKLLNLQNGKILAGGYSFNGTNQVFAQARYTFDNLGITNNANINSFKIYPNPANNQFTIDLGNEIKSVNYQVKILNLLGQEVHHSFEKTIITTIPVTWTGKGLYSVNIYDEQDNLLKTEKIIVE